MRNRRLQAVRAECRSALDADRGRRPPGRAEDALATRVIARTTVEWIGRRNVILDDIARLARPHECTAFVYDGALWLHHPDWNRIRGWRLEAAS